MRWPIRLQLLVPMLFVIVLAVGVSSLASALASQSRIRQQQDEDFKRLVSTLTAASYPLTDNVLQQLAGLSGAEFIVLDRGGAVTAATRTLNARQLETLRDLAAADTPERFSAGPLLTVDGTEFRGSRLSLPGTRLREHSLLVLCPEDLWWSAARQVVYPPLFSGAVAIAAAVLATAVLTRRFVRPIEQLQQQAAAIAGGVFRPLAVPRRNDEHRDLSKSINLMVDRLNSYEDQVRRNERLRTLGQLGAGMAHQLRNWVAGVKLALQLHQRDCPIGEECESFDVATRQLTLVESYLQRFLIFSRGEPVPHCRTWLKPVIEEVAVLIGPVCRHAQVELQLDLADEPHEIDGDPESLRQLLINLLLNAVEAARIEGVEDRRVRVELEAGKTGKSVLRVMDGGCGPAAEVRDNVFEPFVTGRAEGTGLGLWLAREIARDHDAEIGWDRREAMTCFTVAFPTLAADNEAAHAAHPGDR